jgi:hypothetical protein
MACQEGCGCCKGACCYESGGTSICEQQTCQDCELLGGSFQGVGTSCDDTDCPCDPPADHTLCEKCVDGVVADRCDYGEYCCYGYCEPSPCVEALSLPQLIPYAEPTRRDTAVVMAFFRPAEFRRPLENARRVLEDMRAAGIPLFVCELLYPGQEPVLPSPSLVLQAKAPMFHCENLWNVMASRVPKEYTKFIFMDTDLRFSLPDWLDRSSRLLDECDVIQPMATCDWGDMVKPSVAAKFCKTGHWDLGQAHPGFAMGIRRDYWEKIGGLYCRGTLGCSDVINWASFTRVWKPTRHASVVMTPEAEARRDLPPARVGFLPGCRVRHMPHGSRRNRQYQTRYSDYRTSHQVAPNEDGVLEWVREEDATEARRYFASRAEDGGAGSELKLLLGRLGFRVTPQCKCRERADYMDRMGCDWCDQHIDLIDGWLAEEASKRKLPYLSAAGKLLVRIAIRRARKQGIN